MVDHEVEPDPPALGQGHGGAQVYAPGADVADGGGDADLRRAHGVAGLIGGVEHDGHFQRNLYVLAALLLGQLLHDLAPQGAQRPARQGQGRRQAAPAGDPAQHWIVEYQAVGGIGLICSGTGNDQQDLPGVAHADPGLTEQGPRFFKNFRFFAFFQHNQIRTPIFPHEARRGAPRCIRCYIISETPTACNGIFQNFLFFSTAGPTDGPLHPGFCKNFLRLRYFFCFQTDKNNTKTLPDTMACGRPGSAGV